MRSRNAILAAAGDRIANGQECSFGDLARTAGVGLATVYRHFPGRQGLLLALLEQAVERLEEAARVWPSDDPSTFGTLLRAAVGEQVH